MRFVLLLWLVLTAVVAQAQTTTTTMSAPSWMGDLWVDIRPGIALAALALVSTVSAFLVQLLRRLAARAGVDIDDANYARLQTLLENALQHAVSKYAGPVPNLVDSVPVPIVNTAIDYMRANSPDRVRSLTDAQLFDLLLAKAPKVQARITAATAPATVPAVAVSGPQD